MALADTEVLWLLWLLFAVCALPTAHFSQQTQQCDTATPAADTAMSTLAVDVVIIGGGISGLQVARGVLSAGLSCLILEARARVGGRLLSRAGVDLGATWSWHGETRVAKLAAELGVARFAQHESGDAILDRGASAEPVRIRGGAGSRVEGLRFAGGAQALANGLASRLPEGTVRLGARATAVRGWGGVGAEPGAVATIVEFDMGGIRSIVQADLAVVLALPPALAVAAIVFEPALPAQTAAIASTTPTWMASTAKTVVTYSSPFWRKARLSGTAFADGGGPLSEIYDHCGDGDAGAAALFGFSHGGAPTADDVIVQLVRVFGEEAAKPLAVETMDWRTDPLTAGGHMASHGGNPRRNFGSKAFTSGGDGRGGRGATLLWSSTETSTEAAGHIEGALLAASRSVEFIVRRAKVNNK